MHTLVCSTSVGNRENAVIMRHNTFLNVFLHPNNTASISIQCMLELVSIDEIGPTSIALQHQHGRYQGRTMSLKIYRTLHHTLNMLTSLVCKSLLARVI